MLGKGAREGKEVVRIIGERVKVGSVVLFCSCARLIRGRCGGVRTG